MAPRGHLLSDSSVVEAPLDALAFASACIDRVRPWPQLVPLDDEAEGGAAVDLCQLRTKCTSARAIASRRSDR